MSIDTWAAIVFVLFLAIFLFVKRHNIVLQRALFPILYVIMYRSSFGLVSMDRLAKFFPRLLKFLGYLGVVVGFIGMVAISVELVWSSVKVFTDSSVPGIQPVLPVEAKGVFFVPFLYWIISIFSLAVVHEFAHGVIARIHKIPVKSSGFAFLCLILPVVPAAFVEPDEKVVQKRRYREQLSVFAAGPFSNLLFAGVVFLLFLGLSPVVSDAFVESGVLLSGISGPAFDAGLRDGDVLVGLNNVSVNSVNNMTSLLRSLSPGDVVSLTTLNGSFSAVLGSNAQNASLPLLGVKAAPYLVASESFVQEYGAWLPSALRWVAGLLFWLVMLNIGIGMFNLLPIGPLDGGRMFQLACFRFFKNKAVALKVWGLTSFFFVVLIFGNLLMGFIR